MSQLLQIGVDKVLSACRAGAAEAAGALSRTLSELTLTIEEPQKLDFNALPDGFAGPGLAVLLLEGTAGAVVLLPESSGLVPPWCAEPDATGESKLATLAQELGMILLPEECCPQDFKAARVKHLAGALARGGVADGAAMIPMPLTAAGGAKGYAYLIWPAMHPTAMIGAGTAKPKPKAEASAKPAAAVAPAGAAR